MLLSGADSDPKMTRESALLKKARAGTQRGDTQPQSAPTRQPQAAKWPEIIGYRSGTQIQKKKQTPSLLSFVSQNKTYGHFTTEATVS